MAMIEHTKPAEEALSPDDVFIAVMGLTGAGKSTFISLCTQKEISIGHRLESCTTSVSIYTMKHKGKTIHLIDTPGFNDRQRSESEVLQELTYWLSTAYGTVTTEPAARFRLNGIIYLHSIADPRWSGSISRSFNMLRSITGPEAYDAIILATTFWDQVDKATGSSRESQLVNDANKWAQILDNGPKSATVIRHDRQYQSAMYMIGLIASRNTKHDLLIQKELVLPNATLQQTTAGRMAEKLWEEDIARFEAEVAQARQSFADSAQRSRMGLETDVEELHASIKSRCAALEELCLTKEHLSTVWEDRNKTDIEMLQQKLEACHEKIEALTREKSTVDDHNTDTLPPEYTAQPARYVQQLSLDDARRQEKDLLMQRQAKIAARSLNVGVASALFGGLSAVFGGVSAMSACSVM